MQAERNVLSVHSKNPRFSPSTLKVTERERRTNDESPAYHAYCSENDRHHRCQHCKYLRDAEANRISKRCVCHSREGRRKLKGWVGGPTHGDCGYASVGRRGWWCWWSVSSNDRKTVGGRMHDAVRRIEENEKIIVPRRNVLQHEIYFTGFRRDCRWNQMKERESWSSGRASNEYEVAHHFLPLALAHWCSSSPSQCQSRWYCREHLSTMTPSWRRCSPIVVERRVRR